MSNLPKLASVLLEIRPAGILLVTLNTPRNYHAFDPEKYYDLITALDFASKTESIKAVVLTSTGKFFSSGANLKGGDGATAESDTSKEPAAKVYVDTLIDFKKLLVAVVQGPAYGITVTTLPFFDLVYASPEATFTTPFSTLSLCLEGCSSVNFPAFLGPALTSRMLYLAETIKVEEFEKAGLVAEVIPKEKILATILQRLEERLPTLSFASILSSKSLVRSPEIRQRLHDINAAEFKEIAIRRNSEDFQQAMLKFRQKRQTKTAAAKL